MLWYNKDEDNTYIGFSDGIYDSGYDEITYLEISEVDSRLVAQIGKDVYNFKISSATISKLFEGVDIDVEEIPNEIIISVDEDNNITEVKYLLDSYCKVKEICVSNMNITLNYEEFGKVEEITSPLE